MKYRVKQVGEKFFPQRLRLGVYWQCDSYSNGYGGRERYSYDTLSAAKDHITEQINLEEYWARKKAKDRYNRKHVKYHRYP